MLTKSPAERLQSRDPPIGARSRGLRQHTRVRSAGVPRARIGGDTDALDWRSDPRLRAILARVVNAQRAAREKGRPPPRRDGPGQTDVLARRRPDRHPLTPAGAA